ncbi:hypothetical protein [Sinomicrobium sp.]
MKKAFVTSLLFVCFGLCYGTSVTVNSSDLGSEEKQLSDSLGVVKYKDSWYQVGDTIFGYKKYVYLVVGDADSPLFLGAPHDGVAVGNPPIPETGKTGRDIATHPLVNAIATLFEKDTDKKPWIIVNTIHRKRVDPNTYPNKVDGRYTDADAKATYMSYHELLSLGRSVMAERQKGGKGALFLDVHGHAHKYSDGLEQEYESVVTGKTKLSRFICQTEIGYALPNHALEQPDAYLDKLADSSSIASLADRHPDVPFSQLIRGPKSFGGLLAAENVTAVPSVEIPILDRNKRLFGLSKGKAKRRPYFNGGYVTRKYGNARIGSTTGFDDNIIAIQIETPGINVRNNANIRLRSSHQFKRAIIEYLNSWMGYDFPNSRYPY